MIKIAICDDDIKMTDRIKKMISESPHLKTQNHEIGIYHEGKEFLDALDRNHYDAVFLDIEMDNISGDKIAEIIYQEDKNIWIIFVSSHDEMVYSMIKFKPFRFIRKSKLEVEMNETLQALLPEIHKKSRTETFETDLGMVNINIDDIIYFEVYGHDCFCITCKRKYRIKESLESVGSRLSKSGFIRTHRSYIVNYKYIYSINKADIALTHMSMVIPLSRRRMEDVKHKLLLFSR